MEGGESKDNKYELILKKCMDDIKNFPQEVKDKISIIPLFYEEVNEAKDNVDQTGLSTNDVFKNKKLQIVLHHTAFFSNKQSINCFIKNFSSNSGGTRGVGAHFLLQTPAGGMDPFKVNVLGREYDIDPKNKPYIMLFCLDGIPFHVGSRREEDKNKYISPEGDLKEALDSNAIDNMNPKPPRYTMNYSTIGIEVVNLGANYQYISSDNGGQIEDIVSCNEGFIVQKLITDLVLSLYPLLSKNTNLLPVITHAIADPARKQDMNSGICNIRGIYESLCKKYGCSSDLLSWVNDFDKIVTPNRTDDCKLYGRDLLSQIGYTEIDLKNMIGVNISLNMFFDDKYTTTFSPYFKVGKFKIKVINIPNNYKSHFAEEDISDDDLVIDYNNLNGASLKPLIDKVVTGQDITGQSLTFLAVDGGHLRMLIKFTKYKEDGKKEDVTKDIYCSSTDLEKEPSHEICNPIGILLRENIRLK